MPNNSKEFHLQFLLNPDKWPNDFVLPLKRYVSNSSWPETGYVFSTDIIKRIGKVHLGNMFNMLPDDKIIEYAYVEEIINDGWIVD